MFPAIFLLIAAIAAPSQRPTRVVPNFRDLMVKIRHTNGLQHAQVTTWYLKGARERVEHYPDGASPKFVPFTASIQQCDLHSSIHLFLHDKTYTEFVSQHAETGEIERPKHEHPAPAGPEVLITISSVDTGERRQIGAYEAHHIKTTVTIDPAKGAATAPGSADGDSWYLDLPGLYCLANNPRGFEMQMLGSMMMRGIGNHDHTVFKHLGIEPSGLLMEGTMTERSAGNVIVDKTELVDSSDQPLDDSLFEIPPDFTPRERPIIRRAPDPNGQ